MDILWSNSVLYWKWKRGLLYGYTGCQCIGSLLSWLQMTGSCCPLPASRERIVQHIAGQGKGKDQNSKLKVLFLLNAYSLCTIIKPKNCKLNHCKLGTICTWFSESKLQTVVLIEKVINWDPAVLLQAARRHLVDINIKISKHFSWCKQRNSCYILD